MRGGIKIDRIDRLLRVRLHDHAGEVLDECWCDEGTSANDCARAVLREYDRTKRALEGYQEQET